MSSPMAPDKSLAAEIEAVKLALHQRLPIDDDFADDAAKHIVRTVIAPRLAEIAALQSRAFEDGARKRLTDALAAYDAAESKRATASAVYDEISNRLGGYPDIGEIIDRVGAEEACMRASLAADLARSKLIGSLRAALDPTTPEGRTDRARSALTSSNSTTARGRDA